MTAFQMNDISLPIPVKKKCLLSVLVFDGLVRISLPNVVPALAHCSVSLCPYMKGEAPEVWYGASATHEYTLQAPYSCSNFCYFCC